MRKMQFVASSVVGAFLVTAPGGLLSTARGQEAATAKFLLEPVLVEAGGKPIDLLSGGAAPYYGDFDGDGLPDLLLGQFDGGKLRIYRNRGTKEHPRFDDFEWFKAGKAGDDGQVIPNTGSGRTGGGVGFAPQLVDFDGDGFQDVITCAGNGGIVIFRRQQDGSFAEGESLKRPDGLEIVGTSGTSVYAADWDGDGDLDLCVYIQQTGNALLRNTGSRRQPTYGAPEAFKVDGDAIGVRFSGEAPLMADWDSDGLMDLIVGDSGGSVKFYRHVGQAKETIVAERVALVPPAFRDEEAPLPQRGQGARPCVCDFNGDGRLDLLVGDVSVSIVTPEIQLTEAEREHDAALHKKLAALSKKFAEERKSLDNETGPARDERLEGLRVISNQMRQMRRELNRPLPQWVITNHGRVWVYLRR
jgi:hypothetical protein